jgi:DNA polymerase-4
MERVILHCDCNAFFASVERALHPEFGDGPLAVCGDPQARKGIILAKNEAAKRYGIQTGQTVWEARRLCPDLQLTLPHFSDYAAFSRKMNEIYLSYTDLVEPFSIDESYLDVTGSKKLFGDGKTIADEIRRRAKEEVGITVSVGVSFNKVFAKLGSDYKKPDATTVLDRNSYQALLYPLPVDRMMFVGKSTVSALHKLHIFTIGDLAAASPSLLQRALGKAGEQLHIYATGQENAPVEPYGTHHAPKSVGKGLTYRQDLTTLSQVETAIDALCQQVGTKLRAEGYEATQIALTIKDPNLKTVQRQRQFDLPTASSHFLFEGAMRLYYALWADGRPIRALTVTAGGLLKSGQGCAQLSLFDAPDTQQQEKYGKIDSAVDGIRRRFGWDAVENASQLQEESKSASADAKEKE